MELAEIELLVGELELRVDRLRALYDQYFMGIEKLEPMVPRKDVERRFQTLRKEQIRNTAVRFKFQTILQRYNTYQTYWMRICRQIEEGTYRRDVMRAHRRFGNEKRISERPPPKLAGADEAAPGPLPVPRELLPGADDEALSIDVDFSPITEDPFPMPPPSQRTPNAIAESRPRTMRIAPLGSKLPPALVPSFGGPRPAPGAAGAAGAPPPVDAPAGATPGMSLPAPGDLERRISIPPRPRMPSATGEDPKIVVARRGATIVPAGGVSIAPPRGATMMPGALPMPSFAPPGGSISAPTPTPAVPPVPAALPAMPPPASPQSTPATPSRAATPLGGDGRTVAPPRASLGPRPPGTPSRAPAAAGDIAEDRVRQLYSQYIDTKRKHNESTASITYEGLAASLRQSSEKLREKHGRSKSVDFEVIVKDGKTILRPIVR